MAPLSAMEPQLSVAKYFVAAGNTDRFRNQPDAITQLEFGLFGEVGGLLAALKKYSRDKLLESETQVAGEEIGDALWYLVSLAHHSGVKPGDLAISCMRMLRLQLQEAPDPVRADVTFEAIDGLVALHLSELDDQREKLLRTLAATCGGLIAKLQTEFRSWGQGNIAEALGELMAHLTLVAHSFGLGLASVARENMAKIKDRWPDDNREFPPLPDAANCEPHERFERQFSIHFTERRVGSRLVVVQQLKGVNIGDPLTDNSHSDDGYRFHDVFHLSYLAHLGWSPVIRAMFKLKRKSRPKTDENEDGARAIIIEEGIATWIFNHAKARGDFFRGVDEDRLDFSLLKQVRSMVQGFEVANCPSWLWARAIVRGFEVFQQLREHKHGTVTVDMDMRTLTFTPDAARSTST